MTDKDGQNERIRVLLLRLLDAETGEDSMICHDGGFRYGGDFMSMEPGVVEAASIISDEDAQILHARKLISGVSGEVRVTEAGRRLAFRDAT